MPRFWKALILGLIVGAIGAILRPTSPGVRLEEDLGLRWLFAVRGPVDPPSDVVVVTIDRTSAQQIDKTMARRLGLGSEEWPPPRYVHAQVIRSLSRRGASAIMMDVFFSAARTPGEDRDLAEAIAESGKVTLFQRVDRVRISGTETIQTRSPIDQLRNAALAVAPFPLPESASIHSFWGFFDATTSSTPTLPAVVIQIHALPLLDRFLLLLQQAGVPNVNNLSSRVVSAAEFRQVMTVLRQELSHNPHAAQRALTILDRGAVGGLSVAEHGVVRALLKLYSGSDSSYLNFYGPAGHIETVPFHQLLRDDERPRLTLSGKLVIVGEAASLLASNAEQGDTYRTVYSTDEGVDLSGAEIAATAIANLLTDRTLRRVSFRTDVALLIGFGLSVGLFARLLPGLYAGGATLLLAVAFVAAAQYQFAGHARLVPLAIPMLVQLPLGLFAGLLARYRDLRKQVPKEIDPYARPELFDGVCLSTDVENYTVLSEITEPRELALLMGEYYSTLTGLVVRRHGLMMGRAGDSAMCVWRRPRPRSSLARRMSRWLATQGKADKEMRANACLAAIEIREAIDRFNALHPTRPLVTRIGLHAGEIALGPVGGEYHVIGDTPNTAARIQALNKPLATTLLASVFVIRDLDNLCLRPLGSFALPGKSGQLMVVEIIGRAENVAQAVRNLLHRFAGALRSFDAGLWSEAAKLFQDIASDYPSDGPTRYYRSMCERQQGVPPIRADASIKGS
jgi:adenylate cyclase